MAAITQLIPSVRPGRRYRFGPVVVAPPAPKIFDYLDFPKTPTDYLDWPTIDYVDFPVPTDFVDFFGG